jgi:hypothetical protein
VCVLKTSNIGRQRKSFHSTKALETLQARLTEITLVNRARELFSGYGRLRLDLCHIVYVCQGWIRTKFWRYFGSFLS